MSSSTSNSEPLRLIGRALLFSALPIALLLAAFRWGPHASPIDYMGAVVQKHERLASLPSPKVIIIGGSNAAFGMDSERLEKALCKPVVNMSIHASLGFQFMVEEVKNEIGPGDMVIVALEHSGYSQPAKDNDMLVLTADRYPEALAWMPTYLRPKVMAGVAVMRMQGAWKLVSGAWKGKEGDPVYRSSGFNTYGDVISHLDRPARPPERQQHVEHHPPLFGSNFLPLADTLASRVSKAGGQLVFVWPSIARTSFKAEYHEAMRTGLQLHGYTMLGNTEDYVFPDTAFYDTHYHLRAWGRQERTTRLIRDLCQAEALKCCDVGEEAP